MENFFMKEKFEMLLDKDEEIKWSNSVNVKACMLKGLIPAVLIGGFISLWVTLFFGSFIFSEKWDNNGPYLVPILFILPIIIIGYLVFSYLNSKNTYFAITNKRIIKRSGAFNNSFIHYTLKNVGTIQVSGSIADSNNSATLLITAKDFHNDSKGNVNAARLKISSLYNAYEAYRVLNELTEGNNENLRIKIEK